MRQSQPCKRSWLLVSGIGSVLWALCVVRLLADTSAATFATGLLWQITPGSSSAASAPRSYLFGTIHSEDPRVVQLAPAVQEAFDHSSSFCGELSFEAATLTELVQGMMFTDGQDLQAVIGAALFARVAPLMAGHHVPPSALSHFKPWAVVLTLSMPKPKTGVFLDLVLQDMAQQQGKAVCGLETAAEQIAVFDSMSVADQIVLLRETVAQYDAQPQLFESLVERYLARDLAGLLTLSENDVPDAPETRRVYAAFLDRLLKERNARMADRLIPKLQSGGVFIAVGALHLAGAQGLLQLLQERGYRVVAVY